MIIGWTLAWYNPRFAKSFASHLGRFVMTILANVLLAGNTQVEPAATQALAYIFKSSNVLSAAFVEIFRAAGINISLGRIESEIVLDEGFVGRPDLTVYDDSGERRLLIENKFWAGLTAAQPVSYLENLPQERSGLLFIVPRERIRYVWHELKERCANSEFVLGQESNGGSVWWIPVGGRMLLITSWDHILSQLQLSARENGLQNLEQDIIQIQGLAQQMSDAAFRPLSSEELTDQALPKRLMNYFHVVYSVIGALQTDTIVGKTSQGSSDYQMGRYFHVRGNLKLWLGVATDVWQQRGISPLWCWVSSNSLSNVAIAKSKIVRELRLAPNSIYEETNAIYIPVQLEPGVEEDRVIQHAATRVRGIANILVAHIAEKHDHH